jgi:hypothetical protein
MVGGTLLLLSSAAHAFLGWPPLRTSLEQAGVAANVVDALNIGWRFGSVAMLAFGLIVLALGIQLLRGREADRRPAQIVAASYFVFGLVAFVWTHFHLHFVGFMR